MSLYNLMFGVNKMAGFLLGVLNTSHHEIPRFRDCWLAEKGTQIIIYTRTGGGNRPYYDRPGDGDYEGPWNDNIRAIPGFIKDEDDNYDSTYAKFYFEVPETWKQMLVDFASSGVYEEPPSSEERWKQALDEIKAATS